MCQNQDYSMFNDLRLGKPDYLDKMVILQKRRSRLSLLVGQERKVSCEAVAAHQKFLFSSLC